MVREHHLARSHTEQIC